jgi:hypothetical protein
MSLIEGVDGRRRSVRPSAAFRIVKQRLRKDRPVRVDSPRTPTGSKAAPVANEDDAAVLVTSLEQVMAALEEAEAAAALLLDLECDERMGPEWDMPAAPMWSAPVRVVGRAVAEGIVSMM